MRLQYWRNNSGTEVCVTSALPLIAPRELVFENGGSRTALSAPRAAGAPATGADGRSGRQPPRPAAALAPAASRPPRLHLSPAEVGRRDRAASALAAAAEASGGRGGGM
jgi:hypothetical protein